MTSPDPKWRAAIDRLYSEEVERHYESGAAESVLDQSLHPRPSTMLLDMLGPLGIDKTTKVLDIGSRDGRHIRDVRRRYGCCVVGVEPAVGNLMRMRQQVPAAIPRTARGVAEHLPLADDSFDIVWVRDVLVHIPELQTALTEMQRVLAPEGAALIFHMLATDNFGRVDTDLLCAAAGIWRPNLDRDHFEAAVAGAGLRIEHNERLGGEWIEHNIERDGDGTKRLLRMARLIRRPDHYRNVLGDSVYESELGDRLYSVFQLLGKLEANVFVLRSMSS